MQSTGAKIAVAIGSVAIVVVLFIALQGGDDESSTNNATTTTTPSTKTTSEPAKPKIPTIKVRDNEPVGGVRRLTFDKGERVKFNVTSNTDTQIHVHVYDIEKGVPAGGKTRFSFLGDVEGVFEIEDHVSNELVASLRITP